MRTQASKILAVLVFTFCFANSANALRLATVMGTDVLVGDVFVDDVLVKKITWIADANFPLSNNFDYLPDPPQPMQQAGILKWFEANLWIDAMNAANYLGASNWRLPAALQVDSSCSDISGGGFAVGTGCTGSEMGHLFNIEGASELAKFNNSTGLLLPDQSSNTGTYWSSLPTSSHPNAGIVVFGFGNGTQGFQGSDDRNYALAVRDGDLSAVPLPGAVWLMGSALVGLFSFKRKNTL